MALLAQPSTPGWRDVTYTHIKVKGRTRSPYTRQTQTLVWPGEDEQFSFELPSMTVAQSRPWVKWLRQLNRGNHYFVADLSLYLPDDVADRAAVALRLVGNTISARTNPYKEVFIQFVCERNQ